MGRCMGAYDGEKCLVVHVGRKVLIHSGGVVARSGEAEECICDFMHASVSVCTL